MIKKWWARSINTIWPRINKTENRMDNEETIVAIDVVSPESGAEVYIEGDTETRYEIVEIARFHIVPRLILTIREVSK